MGRGRLVDPRRSGRDAGELPRSRAAPREAPEPRHRLLEVGAVHAAADPQLGTRPHPADRRRGARHAAECRARRLQAFEDAYILGRWLDACGDPAEGFANFRRVRIPRVHGVQRLSLSNARFKHMRDAATQKAHIAAGTGSVHGNSDWVWGYDPVADWDKEPAVPASYAA